MSTQSSMEEFLRAYIRKNFYRKQKYIAESAGISDSAVSTFMTGGGMCVYNFERLCKALDITWQPLFMGKPLELTDDRRIPTSQESQSAFAHQRAGSLPENPT